MNDSLVAAINELHLVGFNYDGRDRIVEPHAYGVTRIGNEVLRGYQHCDTPSTRDPSWRLFGVEGLSDLRVLARTFAGPRWSYYRRDDRAMARIFAQL